MIDIRTLDIDLPSIEAQSLVESNNNLKVINTVLFCALGVLSAISIIEFIKRNKEEKK